MSDAKARRHIKRLMTQQGRKWTWLATETGYSRTHITEMMGGRAPLSPKFVKLAATALGVDESAVSA